MPQEIVLEFKNNDFLPALFGEYNSHLKHIENEMDLSISDRGNRLKITGAKQSLQNARIVLESLYTRLEDHEISEVTLADIDAEIRFLSNGKTKGVAHMKNTDTVNIDTSQSQAKGPLIKTKNKVIAPRSPRQVEYLDLIRKKDMVFGLGPAGTGKTYLAVAAAVDMFLQGKVDKLIFCRPAVEAGENLGFLPGDMKEKVDPYIRPIYDALHDMLPMDFLTKKVETGEIEIAPLAFMRGRTLAHAFVILDEAQNTTSAQMKMFLTRMGEASHMVITGDTTQSDLPKHITSGLSEAVGLLSDVDEIGFIRFQGEDVIRHKLVRKIISAYEKNNK